MDTPPPPPPRRPVTRRDRREGRPIKSSSICTDRQMGFNVWTPAREASSSRSAILWITWCFGMILKRGRFCEAAFSASEAYLLKKRRANSPIVSDSRGSRNTLLANIFVMQSLMATAPSPAICRRGSSDKSSDKNRLTIHFIMTVVMAPLCHPAHGKELVVGHWMIFLGDARDQPADSLRSVWSNCCTYLTAAQSARPHFFQLPVWSTGQELRQPGCGAAPKWKLWNRSKAQMHASSLGMCGKRSHGGSIQNGLTWCSVESHCGPPSLDLLIRVAIHACATLMANSFGRLPVACRGLLLDIVEAPCEGAALSQPWPISDHMQHHCPKSLPMWINHSSAGHILQVIANVIHHLVEHVIILMRIGILCHCAQEVPSGVGMAFEGWAKVCNTVFSMMPQNGILDLPHSILFPEWNGKNIQKMLAGDVLDLRRRAPR